MKIAIVYASKHGTTEKVAASIAEKLSVIGEVKMISLKKNKKPDIGGYDLVILGASIYVGKASKKMKRFCMENESVLLQKRTGLFVCGMHPDKAEQENELKNAYPEVLLEKAESTGFLGGEFLFDKMNFLERAIIKKIAKTESSVNRINWEAVYHFVRKFY